MINLSVEAWPYVPAIQRRTYPATPELDKLAKVKDKSQTVGEFLEWLEGQGVVLCTWVDGMTRYQEGSYHVIRRSHELLLAEFFGCDLAKMAAEKQAVFSWLRSERERREVNDG